MTEAVREALQLWGLQDAQVTLAAQRENQVWHVVQGDAAYALRFHRPGYRTLDELRSELQWMAALAERGFAVPGAIPQRDGRWIAEVGDHPVSLLTWLDGRPLGAKGTLQDIDDPGAMCRQLGAQMAELHRLSDDWPLPEGFTRPDWRREGLLGEDPVWGRFWTHPDLSTAERDRLLQTRLVANAELAGLEHGLDQGLIHADLLVENIMIDEGRLAFIDFDDCAFGFRDFELATFLIKFHGTPAWAEMRSALCAGYATRRAVSAGELDLMLVCRALTYPGWIMPRLHEPGGKDRSAKALATALDLSARYLAERRA